MKRASMFLLELLAMVLVFSLCAAVCVGIIGKAWTISQRSERLTQAVYLAESAAAQLQSGADLMQESEQGYAVRVENVRSEEGLSVAQLTVSYEGETVYVLDVTFEEGLT